MFHLAGASGRIHVEEHADAAGHAVGYSHLGRVRAGSSGTWCQPIARAAFAG